MMQGAEYQNQNFTFNSNNRGNNQMNSNSQTKVLKQNNQYQVN